MAQGGAEAWLAAAGGGGAPEGGSTAPPGSEGNSTWGSAPSDHCECAATSTVTHAVVALAAAAAAAGVPLVSGDVRDSCWAALPEPASASEPLPHAGRMLAGLARGAVPLAAGTLPAAAAGGGRCSLELEDGGLLRTPHPHSPDPSTGLTNARDEAVVELLLGERAVRCMLVRGEGARGGRMAR
jgi:hypothetical protein